MENINARVYFSLLDKNILVITQEIEKGTKTTKEQDMEKYKELQNFSINEVDFIELQYGTVAKIFRNSKSYKINLETKSLEVIYYTQEELDAMQQQNQGAQALSDRVSDIADYLRNDNPDLITTVEDSIIQAELDKLLN